MRKRATFTVDEELLERIENTKGEHSASERVNELLRHGLKAEKYQRLAQEAAVFFKKPDPDERAERRAFGKATKRALSKD
jgi:Arc/MetJ family transcription regulator